MRFVFLVSLKQPRAQQDKAVHPRAASYFWSLGKYIWLWLESRMADEGIDGVFAEGSLLISTRDGCREFLFRLFRVVFAGNSFFAC